MNVQNLRVRYLAKADIYKEAELFRKKYLGNRIPVDIETIIDVKLRINIVPKPDLLKLNGFDACISSNWRHLVVDYDLYNANNNRLRFSYAHEIGHFILHKDLYEQFEIKSPEDLSKFYDILPEDQHHFIEAQAHIFANYSLIPRDKLSEIRIKVLNKFLHNNNLKFSDFDPKLLNQYLAGPIAKYFGVSSAPIEIALQDLSK